MRKHCYIISLAFLGFSVGKTFGNVAKYKIFSEFGFRSVDWGFAKPILYAAG